MPRLKFNQKPYYNADQIANAVEADDIFNVYLEETPEVGLSMRRRPGLRPFADLGSVPGDGLYEWEAMKLVIAVNNGRIYRLSEAGAAFDITNDPLAVGTPVVFADGSRANGTPFLYMANGKLVYSDGGGNTLYPTDPATPSTATQVAYLNLKFLANIPSTNRFLFTDVNPSGPAVIDPTYWSSSDNPLTTEAAGDDLVAMTAAWQQLHMWGSASAEVWLDDGVTPFSPLPQAASEVGLEAPYSIVQADNALFALCTIDRVRCIVKLVGTTPRIVSEPISNVLASYDRVSDAIGQLVSVGGVHLYLLQFPSAGKTWAYDIKSDCWVPWGTWDRATGTMRQFIGQHSCYVKSWNKHLIMSRLDGKIYEFDRNAYTDDGAPIKSYRRTPWEDHGSGRRKSSQRLRVKIKTGATVNGAAFLRLADNGAEEWSPYIELPLYPQGKRDFIIDLTRMGQYESRRYEISITDDADLCVVWADEDVAALRF